MINDVYYYIIESFKMYDIVYYQDRNAAMMYCPKCKLNGYKKDKKKLIINFNKKVFNCWVCNYSGRLYKLYKEYSPCYNKDIYAILLHQYDDVKTVDNNKCLDIGNVLFPLLNSQDTTCIIDYLRSKGISYDKILKYHISYDSNYNIYIPSIDNNCKIDGYFFIDPLNDKKRYIGNNNDIFNKIRFNSSCNNIYLVESPLDAIYLDVDNVIVLFGVKNKLQLDSAIFKYVYENRNKNVIIRFDDDATGAAVELLKSLRKYIESKIIIEPLNKISVNLSNY